MSDAAAEPRAGARRYLPRALPIVVVVGFVVLLVYGLLTAGASTTVDQSLADGEAPSAPSFDLPILEPGELPARLDRQVGAQLADGELSLSELAGTPVMLNFWASWCIPCREEAPILERGWRRHGPRGALFLGLNMQDATGNARDFLSEFGITFPTTRETGNEVARSYGALGLPETYFISARGRVVSHVIGVISEEQMRAGVAAARAERVAGTATGGDVRPQR